MSSANREVYSHLPTPQSPNTLGRYLDERPTSPVPNNSIASSSYAPSTPSTVSRKQLSQQCATPESSPPFQHVATTPRNLFTHTNYATPHKPDPPPSSSPLRAASIPSSTLSSPFIARASHPPLPAIDDNPFLATPPTQPIVLPVPPPALPQHQPGGEITRIHQALLESHLSHVREAEARRPEYLQRAKRLDGVHDPSSSSLSDPNAARDQTVYYSDPTYDNDPFPVVGVMDSPVKGRRLKLFQETSDESFEESLMAGGYGRYRTADWVRQPQPLSIVANGYLNIPGSLSAPASSTSPPSGSDVQLTKLEQQGPLTEREMRRRKRLAAFGFGVGVGFSGQSNESGEMGGCGVAAAGCSETSRPRAKLVPVELEGKGRVIVCVDVDVGFDAEGEDPLVTPSKRKTAAAAGQGSSKRRKVKPTPRAPSHTNRTLFSELHPSHTHSHPHTHTHTHDPLSLSNTHEGDANRPNWPDAEFPWRVRGEERVREERVREGERMRLVERYFERDEGGDGNEGDDLEFELDLFGQAGGAGAGVGAQLPLNHAHDHNAASTSYAVYSYPTQTQTQTQATPSHASFNQASASTSTSTSTSYPRGLGKSIPLPTYPTSSYPATSTFPGTTTSTSAPHPMYPIDVVGSRIVPYRPFPVDSADAREALLAKRRVRMLEVRRRRRRAVGAGAGVRGGGGGGGRRDKDRICVCDPRPDDGEEDERQLVQCDGCEMWYHLECIGIRSVDELGAEEDPWFCGWCLREQGGGLDRWEGEAEGEEEGERETDSEDDVAYAMYPASPSVFSSPYAPTHSHAHAHGHGHAPGETDPRTPTFVPTDASFALSSKKLGDASFLGLQQQHVYPNHPAHVFSYAHPHSQVQVQPSSYPLSQAHAVLGLGPQPGPGSGSGSGSGLGSPAWVRAPRTPTRGPRTPRTPTRVMGGGGGRYRDARDGYAESSRSTLVSNANSNANLNTSSIPGPTMPAMPVTPQRAHNNRTFFASHSRSGSGSFPGSSGTDMNTPSHLPPLPLPLDPPFDPTSTPSRGLKFASLTSQWGHRTSSGSLFQTPRGDGEGGGGGGEVGSEGAVGSERISISKEGQLQMQILKSLQSVQGVYPSHSADLTSSTSTNPFPYGRVLQLPGVEESPVRRSVSGSALGSGVGSGTRLGEAVNLAAGSSRSGSSAKESKGTKAKGHRKSNSTSLVIQSQSQSNSHPPTMSSSTSYEDSPIVRSVPRSSRVVHRPQLHQED